MIPDPMLGAFLGDGAGTNVGFDSPSSVDIWSIGNGFSLLCVLRWTNTTGYAQSVLEFRDSSDASQLILALANDSSLAVNMPYQAFDTTSPLYPTIGAPMIVGVSKYPGYTPPRVHMVDFSDIFTPYIQHEDAYSYMPDPWDCTDGILHIGQGEYGALYADFGAFFVWNRALEDWEWEAAALSQHTSNVLMTSGLLRGHEIISGSESPDLVGLGSNVNYINLGVENSLSEWTFDNYGGEEPPDPEGTCFKMTASGLVAVTPRKMTAGGLVTTIGRKKTTGGLYPV